MAIRQPLADRDPSGIYKPRDGEREIIGRRTRSFKLFKGRKKRRIAGQVGPIHFKRDVFSGIDPYEEIDLTILPTPDKDWDWEMTENGYQVRIWNNRLIAGKQLKYVAQFRRAGSWIAIAPLRLLWENDAGDKEAISKPAAGITPDIDNDNYRVTWADCFGAGIDYRYNIDPDEFFKTLIIQNKSDLPMPSITGPGLRLTLILGIAWHRGAITSNGFASSITPDEIAEEPEAREPDEELADSDIFSFKDSRARDLWWLKRPRAWDSADERHIIDLNWRLQRRGNKVFAALSVPASALNNPAVVYPVFMDVSIPEQQVGAGLDDAREVRATHNFRADGSVEQVGSGFGANVRYALAFVFRGIPINNGATVDAATLTVHVGSSQIGTVVNTKLRCHDVGDYPDNISTHAKMSTIFASLTTAETNWDNVETFLTVCTWKTSPDFKGSLEEVFARFDWSNGNDLVVVWDDDDDRSDANQKRQISMYENGATKAAKLNAEFAGAGQIMRISIT